MVTSSPSTHSDAVLLMQARQGDARAFMTLVERSYSRLYGVAYGIVQNHHDAEDVVQEATIKAFQSLYALRGDARFSTWLYRIATNEAIRVVGRRKPSTELTDFTDPKAPSPDTGADVANQIAARETLRTALLDLPISFRVAFVLREFGDLSDAEIAEQEGVTPAAIRQRISRARRLLRGTLQQTA